MKKSVISLGILLTLTGVSFAALDSEKLHDTAMLKKFGYSESTIQAVDLMLYNNSKPGAYQRRYAKKTSANKLGRAYTAIKNYVDPIQDDGIFGEHQIQFTNTWNDDLPGYAIKYAAEDGYENL